MPKLTPRRLIVCADDYALSPGVSLGIRQLAAARRLSATSVMTCMPHWPAEAEALQPLADQIAIGLHFTLTDQTPLGPMPHLAGKGRLPGVARVIGLCLGNRLPTDEIRQELDRQWACFIRYFGRPPDFLDGHQHVHLLPGIDKLVLQAMADRPNPAPCWLRDCVDPWLWRRPEAPKAGLISLLGLRFAQGLRRQGLPCNQGFSGFYDAKRSNLAAALPGLLRQIGDRHLLMVHPGHVDDALRAVDGLTDSRQTEWDFLMGPDFPAFLERQALVLAGREDIP
ncbi:MAG TPA: ChbG/HpnK family deacetylase [Rhodospirillaceae bacterium]|nr:ChbG/HpnK family deacetylase [Rhodospirillaceae bacterium]